MAPGQGTAARRQFLDDGAASGETTSTDVLSGSRRIGRGARLGRGDTGRCPSAVMAAAADWRRRSNECVVVVIKNTSA
jgi:hypothetical protein